ncbi:hypothetical protein BJX65DRAFT_119954 [Aspergillus insuetus]
MTSGPRSGQFHRHAIGNITLNGGGYGIRGSPLRLLINTILGIRGHWDLVAQIARQEGEPLKLSACMSISTLDVVGDPTLGKTFGMLEDVANARYSGWVRYVSPLYSIGRYVPWLCIILRRLSGVVVNRPSDFAN